MNDDKIQKFFGIQTRSTWYTDPIRYKAMKWGSLGLVLFYIFAICVLLYLGLTAYDYDIWRAPYIMGAVLIVTVAFIYLSITNLSKFIFTRKGWEKRK